MDNETKDDIRQIRAAIQNLWLLGLLWTAGMLLLAALLFWTG